MSLLSDKELHDALRMGLWPSTGLPGFEANALSVRPMAPGAIQPASIDLRLGGEFRFWPHPSAQMYANEDSILWSDSPDVIDPMKPGGGLRMLTASLEKDGDTFHLAPGQFVLGHTKETIGVGSCLAVQVYGKSSIGRLGLEVENAGYVDPGFIGQITLELKNSTAFPIRLTVGMPICQIAVHRLTSPASAPYGAPGLGSRYQGQLGATPSRYEIGRQ
jgi:dCTP deaminase